LVAPAAAACGRWRGCYYAWVSGRWFGANGRQLAERYYFHLGFLLLEFSAEVFTPALSLVNLDNHILQRIALVQLDFVNLSIKLSTREFWPLGATLLDIV